MIKLKTLLNEWTDRSFKNLPKRWSKNGNDKDGLTEFERKGGRDNTNKLKHPNKKNNGIPKFKIEIPNKGDVNKIAGTNPIKVLIKAVKTNEIIISLIFIGAMNKFVKFLLQISSRNSILNPILVLKRKS